jgi:hypothetical protein
MVRAVENSAKENIWTRVKEGNNSLNFFVSTALNMRETPFDPPAGIKTTDSVPCPVLVVRRE